MAARCAALRVELWEFSLISISLSSKEQPHFADCSKVRNRRPSERELCQDRWWAGSGHAIHQNLKHGSAIPALVLARRVTLHALMRSPLPAFQHGHASGGRCVGSSFAPGGSWDTRVLLMRCGTGGDGGDGGDNGDGGDGALVCSYISNVRSFSGQDKSCRGMHRGCVCALSV